MYLPNGKPYQIGGITLIDLQVSTNISPTRMPAAGIQIKKSQIKPSQMWKKYMQDHEALRIR